MNINDIYPSKYIKASDLKGRDVRVIMDRIAIEKIGDDQKPVLYFQGKEKGLVLNKTNATNISVAYGDDTADWVGNAIILFSAWVDFQGKSVEAIRCRPPRAADNAPKQQQQREPSRDDITSGPQPSARPSQRDDFDDPIPF